MGLMALMEDWVAITGMGLVTIAVTATIALIKRRRSGSQGEFWPSEDEELSDHELMMRIFVAFKGRELRFEDIRDFILARTDRSRLFSKRTIKPAREYVQGRLEGLAEAGFLVKVGEGYRPIDREEYFRRILSRFLEEKGYRVLEYLA